MNQAKKVKVEKPAEVEVEPLTVDEATRILWRRCTASQRRPLERRPVPRSAAGRGARPEVGRPGPRDGDRWSYVAPCAARPAATAASATTQASPRVGTKQGGRCPERTQGGLVARTPKNNKSRTIPLPPGLASLLRAHKAAQAAERLQAGFLWQDDDWIFATEFGAPIDPRRDWAEWKEVLRRAGVRDARVHDARHTAATLLLANGVDTRTLMDLMGWTEYRTAQRYAHVIDPMRREAMARMGGVLFGQAE